MTDTATPSVPAADPLTPRQRKFVQEYIACLNGAEAARRAGFSVKSAQPQAAKLKRNPIVAEAIARALEERSGITRNYIIDELAQIARGEIAETAVHDRLSALDKLARILGMFKDAGGPVNATQIVINLPDGAERVLYGTPEPKEPA